MTKSSRCRSEYDLDNRINTAKLEQTNKQWNQNRRSFIGLSAGALVAYLIARGIPSAQAQDLTVTLRSPTNYTDYQNQPSLGTPAAGNVRVGSLASKRSAFVDETGKARTISSEQACNFLFWNDNWEYYMRDCLTGEVTSDTLTNLIAAAKAAAPYGGLMHFKGDPTGATHYSLSDEQMQIVFDQGDHNDLGWVIEGDGISTWFYQNTPGLSGIVIKNGSRVQIRDLRINIGPSAFCGIFGDKTGTTNEWSIHDGTISNVEISGGGPGCYLIYLNNPFYSSTDNLRLYCSPGSVAMRLENDSSTTDYGNCTFNHTHIDSGSGADGVQMVSVQTPTTIGLCSFNGLYCNQSPPSGNSGTTGIKLTDGVGGNEFNYIDTEGFDVGIHVGSVSSATVDMPNGNVFHGGLINANSIGIHLGQYSFQNSFKDIFSEVNLSPPGANYGIKDESLAVQYYGPNVFEDVHADGSFSTAGISLFRGGCGGYYFSNNGTQASTADGTTINTRLRATPKVVNVTGSVAGEIVSVSSIVGTSFTVAIKKPDGSPGTTQTVFWSASM